MISGSFFFGFVASPFLNAALGVVPALGWLLVVIYRLVLCRNRVFRFTCSRPTTERATRGTFAGKFRPINASQGRTALRAIRQGPGHRRKAAFRVRCPKDPATDQGKVGDQVNGFAIRDNEGSNQVAGTKSALIL